MKQSETRHACSSAILLRYSYHSEAIHLLLITRTSVIRAASQSRPRLTTSSPEIQSLCPPLLLRATKDTGETHAGVPSECVLEMLQIMQMESSDQALARRSHNGGK